MIAEMAMKYCIHLLLGLIISPLVFTAATAAPSTQSSAGEVYVVQADDGLGKITEKYYYNAALYWFIVQATKAKAEEDDTFAAFGPPFNLEIGQKLWIPAYDTLASHTPFLPQVAEIEMPADTLIFSPDDKLLVLNSWASSGEPKIVQVRDTETWGLRWETNPDWARAVAFSPNGQQLSIHRDDPHRPETHSLYEVTTGQPMVQLLYNGGTVYNVVFSSDGQRLAGAAAGGKLILWDATTYQPVAEFKHDLPISNFMLSPDGPWVAVMTSGSWGPVELVVWDIFTHERRTLAELKGLPNHTNVVFSPDSKWLAASLGYGAPVTIWETQTWPEITQLERPPGFIRQLTFSPDGRWLAVIVDNMEMGNKIMIWEVPAWQVAAPLDMADGVQTIVFSPDSQWLAAGLGDEAQLWEVATGKLLARMPHENQVPAVTFSHNGQWIATGSIDRTVRIWAMSQ